ncbi:hypothetical protein FCIRC_9902 [Fusarium circinatum]|uniref:Uncharacterized protein n=1 Tax=Fusarium circinatum TaxID=48490 RepID=A0A8H5WQP5_FUSCI|nr:hypothetical protein FCIRC_9902 [Fusarium circinatum]
MEVESEGRRHQTRSWNGRWKQAWTPLHKGAVWLFNPREKDTVYTFFAPHSFDSDQLPIYVKVKPEVEDQRRLFSTKFVADHYVPLSALIALGFEYDE